ncbi:chemotaxis response regulator protein-glutamate methylesterase [Dactylosporangium aurantiacum]|uniref:Protein-glutamate methylesterase/protein-glutamine glutaminase n=1 Tax=Dactylosporangium aurantiacum TaxID=35754 RepID=A0A9Q9IDC6_9ACTN|nr:chemotaxis response regulator protein-glutamate methylesterase [Dactylosporangium aurantiacum]MDG6101988.1 chemotaxis response regulator protein-glutamate methylesterase [Dactylosporangium aurantiacum]UWZ53671.1 chemotaxis response regulator protein-glutamate methylesterase [Dactylosporangium aurantiacum]
MISVLVVDDSVVVRRLITDALSDDPGIRVVGTAPNGKVALSKIEQLRPDLVTLDIEMPIMDGLETLRAIRALYARLPVIMFSTLTAAGATATLDALSAGASDYVTKPANVGSVAESIRSVREQIIPRIHALCGGRRGALAAPVRPSIGIGPNIGPNTRTYGAGHAVAPPMAPPLARPGGTPLPGTTRPPVTAPPPAAPVRTAPRTERVEVVTIGCSTGGPDALTTVVRALPANLPVPVVVVQHMPPVFTKMFADRLDRTAALTVVEAAGDMVVRPGTVYIAPGDYHLEVHRRGTEVVTKLNTGPPENFCRPAVDVLFRSVAKTYGGATLAIILTGMGQDGKRGAEQLRGVGAEIVAQDEATSVVWGMPGAVTTAGLAHAVLPLGEIAHHLITRTAGGRGAKSMEVTR